MPGYINHEGEVVQDITDHHSTVVSHRRTTRQRHLSSGQDENIASNYFAAQYGGQQRQAEVGKKHSHIIGPHSSIITRIIFTSSQTLYIRVLLLFRGPARLGANRPVATIADGTVWG